MHYAWDAITQLEFLLVGPESSYPVWDKQSCEQEEEKKIV